MQNKVHYSILIIAFAILTNSTKSLAQKDLPVGFSPEELQQLKRTDFVQPHYETNAITTPPSGSLRAMAQWEEIQALTVTWITFPTVLREIVRAARLETQVYIICGSQCGDSESSIRSYLTSGGVSLTNVNFVNAPCNSVWARDYNANPVYMNDADSLILVDWKYNRPRPADDAVPKYLADALKVPLYAANRNGTQLVNTGGNYMSDGLGNAFCSKLVTDENSYTEAQVDEVMKNFMGITRYTKMKTLPYDGIHHIDMHMKLLNEETLLVGQYPSGVSDGPQIEANLQYILSGFKSAFGTPYKVIRIPQPPDQNNGGKYPSSGGNYLTYTNSSIINNTIIVPQYYAKYDTTALRIFREAMPGYNVVGINSNATISQSGSLHCMTHSVGVANPLWIMHQSLRNTTNTSDPYKVDAKIRHKSGIQSASLYYTTDLAAGYQDVPMTITNATDNIWTGFIPAQSAGKRIYYYIKAKANSGKEQVRPLPAPKAYFYFDVSGTTAINEVNKIDFKAAYPNPSHGITCIPVSLTKSTTGTIKLTDLLGKQVALIYDGDMPVGEKNYFINSLDIKAGAYLIILETAEGRVSQKLMVR
jgi:agmatine/peptidylarginine deiminase